AVGRSLQPLDRLGVRRGDHRWQRRELERSALALLRLGEGECDELLEHGDIAVVRPDDDVGERRDRVRRRLLLLERRGLLALLRLDVRRTHTAAAYPRAL